MLHAAIASGADPTEADRARATELFREGRTLMNAGRTAEACPKLEESQRLDPGGGTLLNVALCHELQGRTATAWSDFHDALTTAQHDGRSDRALAAENHIRDLEPRLTRLTLEIPPEARLPGLTVRRDGVEVAVATWNLASPVDPGDHVVEAEAPGRSPWRATIAVSGEGTSRTVRVPQLEPVPPVPTASPPVVVTLPTPPSPPPAVPEHLAAAPHDAPSPNARPWQRPIAVGVGAVGLVVLGVGAVFGLQAEKEWSDAQPFCSGGKCTTSQAYGSWLDARSHASTATVACVVGGIGLAGGVTLWLTAPASPVRVGANPGGVVAGAEF
jgi:serine/threonine-protein kinase